MKFFAGLILEKDSDSIIQQTRILGKTDALLFQRENNKSALFKHFRQLRIHFERNPIIFLLVNSKRTAKYHKINP